MAATTKKANQEKTASFEIITPREFGRALADLHKARTGSSDGTDTLLKSACVHAIETGSTTNLNKLLKKFGEDKRTRKDVTAMQKWIADNAVMPSQGSEDRPYFKVNSEGFYEVVEGMKVPKLRTDRDLMIRLYAVHWQDCKISKPQKGQNIDLVKSVLTNVEKAEQALALSEQQKADKNIGLIDADDELRKELLAVLARYASKNPNNAKKLIELEEFRRLAGEKLNG
ncbi:hypothetical protein [Endozoicomonas sp. ALC066]|uniref:hypothetical protein n=1 Tax=Endozoicomonas sp. ALC066 TaxID=3403078 RepID=UPI003BB4CA3D